MTGRNLFKFFLKLLEFKLYFRKKDGETMALHVNMVDFIRVMTDISQAN